MLRLQGKTLGSYSRDLFESAFCQGRPVVSETGCVFSQTSSQWVIFTKTSMIWTSRKPSRTFIGLWQGCITLSDNCSGCSWFYSQGEKPKLPNSPNCIRRESHILNVISICFYICPLHRMLLHPFHNYSSCYWYQKFWIAPFISQLWLTI